MRWFRRRKNSVVQDEYVQTTDTVSRPMAIVFTIIIVLVTAALVYSVFLGGRWLFENLDGSDQPAGTTEVVVNPITETTPTAASTSSGSTSGSATNSTSNQSSSTTSATTSSTSSTTNVAGAANSTASTTTIASTGPASSIPATGTTETMSVFIITVLLATLVHNLWLRRQKS